MVMKSVGVAHASHGRSDDVGAGLRRRFFAGFALGGGVAGEMGGLTGRAHVDPRYPPWMNRESPLYIGPSRLLLIARPKRCIRLGQRARFRPGDRVT